MFAVLHLADFALHAVLRTEASHDGQPAALFSGPGKKSLVLAANTAARAAGVEPGLGAPQAIARCPALLIRAPSPVAETEACAALHAAAWLLSPTIEDTAPGVCTIDLRGGEAHAEAAGRAALARLHAVGLPATAGLARTPLLALCAARATERLRHVDDERAFLAPLPLAAADPPADLAAILAGWGVRTLGAFTALPRDEVVHRLGAAGLAFWQRAHGGRVRPLHPVAPPREFAATMEFEHALETLEPLLFILRRFLERLVLELTAAQLVATELALTLRLEDETSHTRRFRLPEPTADPELLLRALHTHLESLQTAAAIAAMTLRLEPARPLVRQTGLFETGLRDPHGFAETLARVAALVGAERVGTPRPLDTHRPDRVRLVAPAAVVSPPAEPPVHAARGLPLRRFRPPLPARLEFTAGEPSYVWTERVAGDITARRGAWPVSGDWWQADRAWARTEWDIALAGGGLYRLVREGEAWFLDGEYD